MKTIKKLVCIGFAFIGTLHGVMTRSMTRSENLIGRVEMELPARMSVKNMRIRKRELKRLINQIGMEKACLYRDYAFRKRHPAVVALCKFDGALYRAIAHRDELRKRINRTKCQKQ